jgi:hypothetical protein
LVVQIYSDPPPMQVQVLTEVKQQVLVPVVVLRQVQIAMHL